MMNQAPAVGAQPMADPNAGASAMPAQDPNAMPADPNAMAMDPMAGGMDPNAGMDMGAEGMTDDGGIDGQDIATIFDELPDVDKDAAEGYIKYLQRKNNGQEPDPNAIPAEDPNAMAQQPMMESVVFSKKQLDKVHENLCNGVMDKQDRDDKPVAKKKDRNMGTKSPFSAKKFSDKQDI